VDGKAVGVRAKSAGQEIDIPSRIVVDASGRQTLLGRQLSLKQNDPIFNQYAVHAWFENVERGDNPKTADYIHIYFLPVKRGWAWQIPITDRITSVGVVAEREVFQQFKSESERYFDTYVQSNKGLSRAMANAVRVNDFKTEGDYSYVLDKFCGNGFLMIGDAARFVDPIFSSGVSVAMYSARYAAETIQGALQSGDLSEEAFKPYERCCFKPAPELYHLAARRLSVEPAQVRLVAAHDWDVTGALRAGCAAVFVARPGQVMNPFGPQPDMSGADLDQVVDQILAVEVGQG
jgi:FADH2 O2-dependent halogenase